MNREEFSPAPAWVPEIGEVLKLPDDLGEMRAGLYIVVDLGWQVTLSQASENEDGDFCTTARLHEVSIEELLCFEPTYLILPL